PEVRTRTERGGGGARGVGGDLRAAVVGGGLAGSEAAWALAERAVRVTLYEMRPVKMTAAHQTDRLAELVCSNSFKSVELSNAHGLLKAEMRRLGSIVLEAADAACVPGGAALAVDRLAFSRGVHDRVTGHPNVTVVREEMTDLSSPSVVATGPRAGEQSPPHRELDETPPPPPPYFEGCLPVEEMAARGRDVLRFGPMKPVGLSNPGRKPGDPEPYAVVQLRQEDSAGQMWN